MKHRLQFFTVLSIILGIYFVPVTASASLLTNIVSAWNMDNNSNDSASTNNGSDTAMSYSTTGAIWNKAAQFNGSTSFISVGSVSALNLESIDSTISFWIRPTNIGTQQYLLWKGQYAVNQSYWTVRMESTGRLTCLFSYNLDAAYDDYIGTTALSNNTLYNVVCTHVAGTRTIKLYINDVEGGVTTLTNGAAPSTVDTTALLFGAQNPAGTPITFYTGALDAINIWSRVLSGAEIASLYNGGVSASVTQYPFTAPTFQLWPLSLF